MDTIFKGKTVLITGGTGYLGRALAREILKYEPQSIRLLGRDEVKHHRTQEEFEHNEKLRHFVGDVRDYTRLLSATREADIVIHAAAMKRIDLIEYNVTEAVKTNVQGTMNVVRACLESDVEKVVFVSTDKACSPINSYGATKMLGEKIFIESNYSKGDKKTSFVAVRYGNVLDSTGSVIPFFVDRIKKGKSIPLTDKRMTRFMISANHAVQLIFDALKYGEGGELFVPNLKAFKIQDLAEVLKEHHGSDSKIEETGIRPGEKIHEDLLNEEECRRAFHLKNNIVVLSEINYPVKLDAKTEYLEETNRFSGSSYCSKDCIVEKGKIKEILEKAGVL